MKSSTRIKITAYAILGIYALVLFALNIHLPSLASRLLGLLPLVILGAFAVYDSWLWRRGPLLRAAKQPVLIGTWAGTLTSYRRDNAGKPMTSQHDVIVVIRQTLTSLSIVMMTEQSRSRSSIAQVSVPDPGDFVIQYQYQNDPRMQYRDVSQIHSGGAEMRAGGLRPDRLDGEYWTARESRGTFDLQWVDSALATSFADGMRMAAKSGGTP